MLDPEKVTYFGETDSRGRRVKFGIKSKDRSKHTYVIGKSGMGKSTLLENMAVQDIQSGEGLCFIDPHGGTAEKLLDYIPEERVKDVIYFAPFDLEYPISFNVMEDIGADKRHLVVNGLMSTFEKIWVDAWSARMAYILNNTLLALLEYPGATLLGVNRMLSDKDYRNKVVDNVQDSTVKSFWVDEFAKYTEKYAAEATPAIQNKIGQFTSNPLVRNIIGQSGSSFNIREIMDQRKILIVNLSKGRVGEGNANLIGSMLITKIYLAAMSRADKSESELRDLPNFYLYVDEFQSFANKSFADILSEARKYKLNLTIAHQYIEQMEEEVRDAVFGNVGSMIAFRVGAFDAEVLEKEFSPTFTAEDLVNLGLRQIYLKLMIDGVTSLPFSATTLPPITMPPSSFREAVIESSRKQFALPRAIVEQTIREWHEQGRAEPKTLKGAKIIEGEVVSKREPKAIDFRGKKPERVETSPAVWGDKREERPRYSPPRDDHRAVEKNLKKEMFKEVVQKESPQDAQDGFKPLSAVSLAEIKKKADNQRKPSPQNISELRNVLSSMIKKEPSKPEPVKERSESKEMPNAKAPEPKSEPKIDPKPTEEKKPNEIPEATLKALFEVS